MAVQEFKTEQGVIAYIQRGLGDPVLLIHGLYPGASHNEFQHNVSVLQQHFTVYAVDLLGYGQSDCPRISHTAEMHQHMMRDFVRGVIGKSTSIVTSGMSCGIGVRLGVYDDALIDHLVLLSPVQKAAYREEHSLVDRLTRFVLGTLSAGFSVYETAASRAGLREFLEGSYHDPSKINKALIDTLHKEANETNKMMPYISVLCSYFDTDLAHWLPYNRRPVQIIMGADLMPVPETDWLKPAQWSMGKRIDVINDAKAFPHVEQSAATNQLMIDFMEGRLVGA